MGADPLHHGRLHLVATTPANAAAATVRFTVTNASSGKSALIDVDDVALGPA